MEIGNQEKLVVGLFDTMHEAKKAIFALHKHGFPVSRVSVIAKELGNDRREKNQTKRTKTRNNRILDRILDFEFIEKHFPRLVEHFHTGKFFLVAIGTSDEVARAYGILIDAKAEIVNHNSELHAAGK